jgi:hypothetical protein
MRAGSTQRLLHVARPRLLRFVVERTYFHVLVLRSL